MKICVHQDLAALEAASVVSGLDVIRIHVDLDGPEPPEDSLARHIESSHAHETDISPAKARSIGRAQRQRSFELRQRPVRSCRRGPHLLTPDNIVDGGCRACKNAARKARRNARNAA